MTGRRSRRREAGFTLVELLVVMAMTGVIAGAIVSVTISMLRAQSQVVEISDVLAEARAGLIRTQDELREAKRLYPSGGPTAPCDPRELSFWLDSDRDGLLQSDELVTYTLDVTDGVGALQRWTADAPTVKRTLARQLEVADVFDCKDEPPNTRVIDIAVSILGHRGLHDTALDGSVRLRNVD